MGCLLWLVFLGFVSYVALQAVPAKMKAAELEEFMTRQAERALDTRPEKIEAAVLGRIKELELPFDKKALDVKKGGGRVRISYSYTVPINLVVTTHDWAFDVKVDRPMFVL